MRTCVATWLVILAACGVNPAFTPTTTTGGPDDTSTGAPPGASTGPDPGSSGAAPTTTAADTTGAVDATGPADTTTTTTTTDATTATTDATTTTAATLIETTGASDEVPCPKHLHLLACYTFPDGAATVLIDDSPSEFDGEKYFADQVESLAGYGSAAQFLPQSDVFVPFLEPLNTPRFTIAVFAWLEPGAVERPLLDKQDQYGLFAGGGKARCTVKNNSDGPPVSAVTSVPSETWVHLACMFDGDEIRLHVAFPGAPQAPVVAPLTGVVDPDPKSPLRLGFDPPDVSTKFNGKLDHVLVFAEPLDEDTVCELAGPLCP